MNNAYQHDLAIQKYNQLPENAKKEIDSAFEEKDFLRQVIDEIKRSDIKEVSDLSCWTKKGLTNASKIETKQEILLKIVHGIRGEARDLCHDTRQYGFWGAQQIQRGVLGPSQIDNLPVPFYEKALKDTEKRLVSCEEEASCLQAQFQLPARDIFRHQLEEGSNTVYGHRSNRLQPKQIAQLIRNQNDAFIRIAAAVAESHKQVSQLKEGYIATIGKQDAGGGDPFLAADNRELSDKKLRDRERQRLLQFAPASTSELLGTTRPPNTSEISFGQQAMSSNSGSSLPLLSTSQSFGAPVNAPSSAGNMFGAAPFGFGSSQQPAAFSTSLSTTSFGSHAQPLQQTSAAGDLVTPSLTQKISISSDRMHKKKAGNRGIGSGKH